MYLEKHSLSPSFFSPGGHCHWHLAFPPKAVPVFTHT